MESEDPTSSPDPFETTVGVGPYPGPWPDDPRLDPVLLAEGDRRNVIDEFRYWRVEAVADELARRAAPLHVAIQNWEHDFNIGSIVRTANAFGVAGVHILGRRRWNRRGAMVTDRYLRVTHHPDVESLTSWAAESQIPLIGVDNVDGSVPIETATLPSPACLIFGSEGPGLTDEILAACQMTVAITQYGSTRSMNAGAAAAVAMFAWSLQHRHSQG